jgi:hypothetical protein
MILRHAGMVNHFIEICLEGLVHSAQQVSRELATASGTKSLMSHIRNMKKVLVNLPDIDPTILSEHADILMNTWRRTITRAGPVI